MLNLGDSSYKSSRSEQQVKLLIELQGLEIKFHIVIILSFFSSIILQRIA